MIRTVLCGVGVWGPGLPGWAAARAVLRGEAPWQAEDVPPPPPALLAPAERRRAGAAVRLALTVAAEASAGAGLAPGSVAGVFATSNGDGAVVGALLETLASADPLVSPTQFHNSVHNAAAGYWSIAMRSHAPVTCLSGHDGSFAAGLLRAAAEVASSGAPVLLVAYDLPLPMPAAVLRGTRFAFATALVLAPAGVPVLAADGQPPGGPASVRAAVRPPPDAGRLAGPATADLVMTESLVVGPGPGPGADPSAAEPGRAGFGAADSRLADPGQGGPALAELRVGFAAAPAPAARTLPRRPALHGLAAANPAARSLRLLEALATGRPARLSLALFHGRVDVEVRPCSTPDASAR